LNPPTILVAESNALLRDRVSQTLQRRHLGVVLAETGAEALDLIADSLSFDGLYTDTRLAGSIDGWSVGAGFYERWPTKPIVYVSDRDLFERITLTPGMFVRKPFDVDRLAELFRP
jgi:DNA-binding NtrC family response regulator